MLARAPLEHARRMAGAFARCRDGTVAVMFALLALPLFGLVAAAIDYARAVNLRMSLQHAADNAAFAARSKVFGSESEMRDVVRANLDANLPRHLKGMPFAMKVPADRSTITIEMDTKVPTTLLGIVGVQQLDVAIAATARLSPKMPGGAIAGAMPGLGGALPPEAARALESATRGLGAGSGLAAGFGGGRGAGGAPALVLPSSEADMLRAAEQARAELQRAFGGGGFASGTGTPTLNPADLERLKGAFRR